MAVLLHPGSDGDTWLAALRAELPGVEIRLWPEVGERDEIEVAVLSQHDAADLATYPNLRAVQAMGAGVEQFTAPGMPEVPIVRLVDPAMSDEMAAYALHWIVHFERRVDAYVEQQRSALWLEQHSRGASECPVGILGYGHIGRRVASLIAAAGHPVNGWSRGTASGAGDATSTGDEVTHFVGSGQLGAFLAASQVVVNVLPSTASTRGLVDADRLTQFRAGAGFVNMGRGATVDEVALVDALDRGRLAWAVLDVTREEPLPAASPLWRHPRVRITPHVAGPTRPATAAPIIAANVRRVLAGEEPHPLYDRARDY